MIDRAARHPNGVAALFFALCAYVPILFTDPGRVSADTKSYLTIDPTAVLRQATSMWDPSVGAGTVPHQNIGYLFPLGPYYWLMEAAGIPDWVTQRLLWGTLVVAAAYGMYRLARWLGWSATGAVVAGFAYGFSPYVLSYLARLSVILGPWAALPWMILLAAKAARTRSWKPAAQFAVIVALVGSVNATSLVLAGLGPVIWLLVEALSGRVRTADAVRAAAKIGVLSASVSLWWVIALRVQGTYGIPILRYTETYQSVASASTPAEIMRALGYWLLYGGDRLDPWVEPAGPYFDSALVMTLGFVLAGIALLGFLTRFPGRAAAATLLLVGLAVAVGAAPLDNSTPYGRLFLWFATDTTAGLALRSTPRAAPLVTFALALGVAASTEWVRHHLVRRRAEHGLTERRRWVPAPWLVPVAAVGLLGLQFFPWFSADSLSSSLQRDENLPAHTTDIATWLDANADPDLDGGGGRVWEIPAADFASYRWGGTVDAVLPGLIERPYLARDVVLQGGPATADLLNAFERRLPEGWFEPETLVPVAHRFGVDTVVVRNDLEHERFLLARPGSLWPGITRALGAPDHAGPLVTDDTVIPLIDERTLADVDLVERFPVVAAFDLSPVPRVTSASAAQPIVMVGNAEGVVDLAGAQLLDPDRPLLFAATLDDLAASGDLDPAAIGTDPWWVLTDTDRKQARRWSTVSSNLGALEAAGPLTLDDDPSNQSLDVFDPSRAGGRQTVAVHAGDVADVRASYYGNRVAFTTGDAPAFAIDGDPSTAWRAGAFTETTGLRWEVDLVRPVQTSTIGLLQPISGATNRYVVEARLTLDAGLDSEVSVDITLDDRSRSQPGQTIDLPAESFQTLRYEVLRDNLGPLADYSAEPGIGLAEVIIPGVRDDRLVRLPSLDAFEFLYTDAAADQRLTYVMTRQRIDPATPNESAGEPVFAREFDVPATRPFALSAEARIAGRASEQTLSELFGDRYLVVADRRLGGSPASRGASAFDGDVTTAWRTPFDEVSGATVTVEHPQPITVETMTLTWRDDGRHSVPIELVLTDDTGAVWSLAVPPTPPVDGVASAVLPIDGYTSATSTLTVTAVDERTTPEYFSSRPKTLPLGIAEIAFGTSPELAVDLDGPLDDRCREDLLSLDDRPVPVRLVGSRAEAINRGELAVIACGTPLELETGWHRLRATDGAISGLNIDRVVLDAPAIEAPAVAPPPTVEVDAVADTRLAVTVAESDEPSWLVLQQSWNAGWTARADGVDLGAPVLIDAYANGWLLPPSETPRSVVLEWTPQRTVTVGLWFSFAAGIGVLALLVLTRRDRVPRTIHDGSEPHDTGRAERWRHHPALAAALIGIIAVLAGPIVAAGSLAVIALTPRFRWLPVAVIVVAGGLAAGAITAMEFRYDFPPGPDWPSRFGWTAPLVWLAVASTVGVAIMPNGVRRTK